MGKLVSVVAVAALTVLAVPVAVNAASLQSKIDTLQDQIDNLVCVRS